MALRKGDIVRVKRGFDRSLEGMAVRRAGLPLKEDCLYQIVAFERGETDAVLILRKVRVFRVGGVRHIVKVRSETFPYVSERFELVYAI